jgi:hypothetical protein
MKIPEKARYTSKRNVPSFYLSRTFYVMQICGGKMYGKIKIKTNAV